MKNVLKGAGMFVALTAAVLYTAEAIMTAPRAKLRAYIIGDRAFAEISGVKSQDIRKITKNVVKIATLFYPIRYEEWDNTESKAYWMGLHLRPSKQTP